MQTARNGNIADKSAVQNAAQDTADCRVGMLALDRKMHCRMRLHERVDARINHIVDQGVDGRKVQNMATAVIADGLHFLPQLAPLLGELYKAFALRGKGNRAQAFSAPQKLKAEFLFQRLNRSAQGGLADIELFSGCCQISITNGGKQGVDLSIIHSGIPPRLTDFIGCICRTYEIGLEKLTNDAKYAYLLYYMRFLSFYKKKMSAYTKGNSRTCKNILIIGRHMILFFCERHESCALFQNIIFLNIYNEGRKGSVGRILS